MRINLTERGHHVITAANGTGAPRAGPDGTGGLRAGPDRTGGLRAASAAQPDVIVLDLGLPDMDGTEVITTIRRWSVTPVIVPWPRTDSSIKIRTLDAVAADYVTKPVGMEKLMARTCEPPSGGSQRPARSTNPRSTSARSPWTPA